MAQRRITSGRGGNILVPHQFDFPGHHRQFARRPDADLHPRTPDVRDDHFDIVADQNGLSFPPRHHEHTGASSGTRACWCEYSESAATACTALWFLRLMTTGPSRFAVGPVSRIEIG